MSDGQALIEINDAFLNSERSLAQTAQGWRQLFENLRGAAEVLARKLDAQALSLGLAGVNSPSLTARWSKSQDATCIRRVVRRMLSVE